MGLNKLKQTYKNNSIEMGLDLLIMILSDFINNKNQISDMYKNQTSVINDITISHNSKINLYKVFTNIWDDNDINNIFYYFKSLNTNYCNKKDYIDSVESIIKSKRGEIKLKIDQLKNLI